MLKKRFSILGFNFYGGRSEPLNPFGAKGRAGVLSFLYPVDPVVPQNANSSILHNVHYRT